MKLRNSIDSIEWGIDPIDQVTQGIPKNEMAVIETPDYRSGMLVLGHFLFTGLSKGEKCVLITIDSPKTFLNNFLLWNMDFEKFIDNEKLIFLNYKPNFIFEVGLAQKYDDIFQEIKELSQGTMPNRIAIQQIDSLVNLHNLTLMTGAAQKLSLAATSKVTEDTTILGQFVQFNDQTHKDLGIVFQKTLSAYHSLTNHPNNNPNNFLFHTLKLPWFSYLYKDLHLILKEGKGFIFEGDSSELVA